MLFTRTKLQELQTKLGVNLRKPELIELAFTHRSYLNETARNDLEHNERLEFLGDAVLELAITLYLYKRLPDTPERLMTGIRSALVNFKTLGEISEELGFDKFLLLSRGERKALENRERSRPGIMADTFEAVLGAMFLDRGMGVVEIFLGSCFFPRLQKVIADQLHIDPKSCLQEMTQSTWKMLPSYQLIREEGPNHNKKFVSAVYVGEEWIGEGSGASKLEAETEAARVALQQKFNVVLARV